MTSNANNYEFKSRQTACAATTKVLEDVGFSATGGGDDFTQYISADSALLFNVYDGGSWEHLKSNNPDVTLVSGADSVELVNYLAWRATTDTPATPAQPEPDAFATAASFLRDHGFTEFPVGQEDGVPFINGDAEVVFYVYFDGTWAQLVHDNWENEVKRGSNYAELEAYVLHLSGEATPATPSHPASDSPYAPAIAECEALLKTLRNCEAGTGSDSVALYYLERLAEAVNRWSR